MNPKNMMNKMASYMQNQMVNIQGDNMLESKDILKVGLFQFPLSFGLSLQIVNKSSLPFYSRAVFQNALVTFAAKNRWGVRSSVVIPR